MSNDFGKPSLTLLGAAKDVYDKVSSQISPEDGMFHGNTAHYFSCGASAFSIISIATNLAGLQNVDSVLDFGSGAGRVTRWLKAAYPRARLSVTDMREGDLAFCVREFDASSWISGTSIENLSSSRSYDVIWVGSVITHLPERTSIDLIHKLLSWLNPLGILVFSTHGRFAHSNGPSASNYGIEDRWTKVELDFNNGQGYGYADYPHQKGYGISLIKPSWTTRLIEKIPELKLILFSESAWDGHHDIVAIQNKAVIRQNAPKSVNEKRPTRLIPSRVISVHFPKAAGSSLHFQLSTQLGDDLFLDLTHDPLTPAGDERAEFPSDKRVVHGHFRASRYASTQAYWITFLRNPIDNLISIYYYWKSHGLRGHALHQRFMAERPSILDFARYPGIQKLMSETYFGSFDMDHFDFIGFHETRDVDIPRLGEALGLPLTTETHIRKTTDSSERSRIEGDASIRRSLGHLLAEDVAFYNSLRDKSA